MEKLFIRKNFLPNAEKIRNLSLTSRFYSPDELDRRVNWKGFRTKELSYFKNELLDQSKSYILDEIVKEYKPKNKLNIETSFHLTLSDTKNTLDNFDKNKWHRDTNYNYAGVIYLTPHPPKNSGTSIILDDEQIDVQNCFNKIVAYPSYLTHAPTDLFGDTVQNGRITLTFFCYD
tara:strand:+ start:378 stop:902 length:525 start_codon:yes stop_codon:yes gene_type:complete